jgi:hypothetical protein
MKINIYKQIKVKKVMKKVMLSLALMIGLGVTQINAQSSSSEANADSDKAKRVSIGIKIDATMSNFILSDMGGVESTMGAGENFGGLVYIDFGRYFALQPELLFHIKNSTMKQNGVKSDFQYLGVEAPLYAVVQLRCSYGDRAYLGVGPFGELGFSAKNKTGGSTVNLYKSDFMRVWNVGAGALLGYEFDFNSFRLQINASYKIGLINALDGGNGDAEMKSQTVSLGIGIRF